MPDTAALMRQKLKSCNLLSLFIEELGWNHHRALPLIIEIDGENYTLNAIAEKHGMVAYECQPDHNGRIPEYSTRGKIEKQVAKSAHEHLIVFVNGDKTAQTWQWVRREKGKPTARREHPYICNQPGDSLIQKLQKLAISLEEEEKLTIVDVAGKVRQAFDVDRVTKRFYDRFKDEHQAFLNFIKGIEGIADREWYASLMLNRLMFIYFIQKKSFLDSDKDYLRNRLQMVRQSQGQGKFHTFYRYFLRRLFHEGLALRKEDRKEELKTLLGNVPYLNGGLFDTHQLEKDNPDIQIPDEAFEKLFNFFDAYQWHLDERPTRADNEINPDVLGYIFEKYINQKQMGAFYTKEDITEYISKSTIVPFLFDAAEKKCAIAFSPDSAVWRLLRDDPDRYIFEAMKKGVDLMLPDDIAVGIADVSKRTSWNRPANDEFALPTETWREHFARRTRCLEVRAKLAAGEIHNINDLITYNLDLRQFAQDVIETCEGPELLRAIYQSIAEISVLDPTCGSGAFLFAALNILEPLYEACLERMGAFIYELDKSGEKHHPEKFSDFRKVLEQANDPKKHPSRRYFILKSIVLKNLYGVDIMEEAVEICKLRLFLKLVAQVERVEDVEPLPDIDFNIRAGNTLVGFTSLEAVKRAMTIKSDGRYRMLMPDDEVALKRINESAELSDTAFRQFRDQQTNHGMQANEYVEAKNDLQNRLSGLRVELDKYLAQEYGIDIENANKFDNWRISHQPFHWFVEFFGIIMKGYGFDIIIGNPPYIEYSPNKFSYTIKGQEYTTFPSRNVYSFIFERSKLLSKNDSRVGMIVQISSISTPNMETMVQEIKNGAACNWISNYATRPSYLFEGVTMNLSIIISKVYKMPNKIHSNIYSSNYLRWKPEFRKYLFQCIPLNKVDHELLLFNFSIPKLTSANENLILKKIIGQTKTISHYLEPRNRPTEQQLFYRTAGGRYYKIYLDSEFGSESKSNKSKYLQQQYSVYVIIAVLSSNLWWWYYTLHFDMYNCKDYMMYNFPFDYDSCLFTSELHELGKQLCDDLKNNAEEKIQSYETTGNRVQLIFKPSLSKTIIDNIDKLLANHYELTNDEQDFITNYDIKYRTATESNGEEE